jgi:hypothetical protein
MSNGQLLYIFSVNGVQHSLVSHRFSNAPPCQMLETGPPVFPNAVSTYIRRERTVPVRICRRLQAKIVQLIRIVVQDIFDRSDSLVSGQIILLHHLDKDVLQSFSALNIRQPIRLRL